MQFGLRRLFSCFALIAPCLLGGSRAIAAPISSDPATVGRLRADITALTSLPSRVPGTPGYAKAAAYVKQRFAAVGLQNIGVQTYDVTVPVTTKKAQLTLNGKTLSLLPIYPNHVVPSSTPPEGISGPLIYAGQGRPADYNGQKIDGAIVALDFNSGMNWYTAADLGARAIIFLAPPSGSSLRGEAEEKFSELPLEVPRYYATPETAREIPGTLDYKRLPGSSAINVGQATVKSQVLWQRVQAQNIVGEIPGTDGSLKGKPQSVLAIGGYFDSMSITPDLAPGAEAAGNMAALLELASYFKAHPPRYTLQFVAEGAHHLAMAGMRNWVKQNLADIDPNTDAGKDQAVKDRIATYKGFIGLDLTSRTPTVGLFAKSAFYNQMGTGSENILLNYYADFAKSLQVLAARVDARNPNLSEYYVDGIRGQEGRNWRSYLPTPVALDSEVSTRAAKPSISFATANDARAFQDTPFDTPERMNLPNLAYQLRTVETLMSTMQQPGLDGTKTDVISKLPDERNFSNIFGYVMGRAIYRNMTEGTSFLPNTPIPDDQILKTPNGTQAVAYVLDQGNPARRDDFKTYCGVRGAMIERATYAEANPAQREPQVAQFEILGPRTGDPRGGGTPGTEIEAYSISGTGHILYAPDMGSERARFSPTFTTAKATYDWHDKSRNALNPDTSTICFACRATALFDTVDQRYFSVLKEMTVLDSGTDAEPIQYGFRAPSAPTGVSDIEPVAIVFGRPKTSFKLIMAQGLLGKRLVLLNATPTDAKAPPTQQFEGAGFTIPDDPNASSVVRVPYQAARDLWTLDQQRIRLLKKFGITNQRVDILHGSAGCPADPKKANIYHCPARDISAPTGGYIKAAEQALSAFQYDKFYLNARRAFGLESRAYPDVEATAQDVLKGIIFYLALLLPFSFFMERLLFGFPDIRKQIMGTSGCFFIIFFVISKVHPAFELALTPMIILLAFIILALTVIVTSFLSSKFEAEIKRLKQGVHFADVGRLSALGAALGLGIANMRRRPSRTALTCVTLILLTFTVLSFTSVTANISNYARPYGDSGQTPSRAGVMIRQPNWSGMPLPAVNSLRNEFGQEFGAVAPRAWLLSRAQTESLSLRVSNADDPGYYFIASALSGWTPDETTIGSPAPKTVIKGRWFQPGDPSNVCLLPKAIFEPVKDTTTDAADDTSDNAATGNATGNSTSGDTTSGDTTLSSTAPQIGRTLEQWQGTKVIIGGQEFTCIGVYDDAQWTGQNAAGNGGETADTHAPQAIRDLDDEKMTPVDYGASASQQSNTQADTSTQQGQAVQVQRYDHMNANALPLLPYETVLAMGGQTRSVAASFRTPASGQNALNGLMNRAAIGIFGAIPETDGKLDPKGTLVSRLYSSVESVSYDGFASLLVPILIAALIIANTMLGSVFERTREIGIYSSIGLAPIHVAALFIAEAIVYAVLGSISGYLIAQFVAKIVTAYSLLPGITLNYSSSSAVIATLIVMATVLLSTIYPAVQAGRLSQPDREGRSDLGEPVGDIWRLQFPFTVSGQQTLGMSQFLVDFFETHTDTSVGVFYTDKVTFSSLPLHEAVTFLNTDTEGNPLSVAGHLNGAANGKKKRGKRQPESANGVANGSNGQAAPDEAAQAEAVALQTGDISLAPDGPGGGNPAQKGLLSVDELAADAEQEVFRLSMRVWLAPFDMGVSQDTDIFLMPSAEPGLNELQLKLVRRSGEIASWKRVNRGFLGDLRKQLLLWRTLKPVTQQEYILRGRAHIQGQALPVEEPGTVVV